jgi:hypothetical protein
MCQILPSGMSVLIPTLFYGMNHTDPAEQAREYLHRLDRIPPECIQTLKDLRAVLTLLQLSLDCLRQSQAMKEAAILEAA